MYLKGIWNERRKNQPNIFFFVFRFKDGAVTEVGEISWFCEQKQREGFLKFAVNHYRGSNMQARLFVLK